MPNGAFGWCYKEECAWYDIIEEECSITQIINNLERINDKLTKILEKLEK